jgi:hypothetical protein
MLVSNFFQRKLRKGNEKRPSSKQEKVEVRSHKMQIEKLSSFCWAKWREQLSVVFFTASLLSLLDGKIFGFQPQICGLFHTCVSVQMQSTSHCRLFHDNRFDREWILHSGNIFSTLLKIQNPHEIKWQWFNC